VAESENFCCKWFFCPAVATVSGGTEYFTYDAYEKNGFVALPFIRGTFLLIDINENILMNGTINAKTRKIHLKRILKP
jgi:hypothetical protein